MEAIYNLFDDSDSDLDDLDFDDSDDDDSDDDVQVTIGEIQAKSFE